MPAHYHPRLLARLVLPEPVLQHAVDLAHAIDGEFTPLEVDEALREDLCTILDRYDHPFTGCLWEVLDSESDDVSEPEPESEVEAPPEGEPEPEPKPEEEGEGAAPPVRTGTLLIRHDDTVAVIDVVLTILQSALRRADCADAITLEWIGEPTGPGGPYGAAALVTAQEIVWVNTRAWLAAALEGRKLRTLSEDSGPDLPPIFATLDPSPHPPAPPAAPEEATAEQEAQPEEAEAEPALPDAAGPGAPEETEPAAESSSA